MGGSSRNSSRDTVSTMEPGWATERQSGGSDTHGPDNHTQDTSAPPTQLDGELQTHSSRAALTYLTILGPCLPPVGNNKTHCAGTEGLKGSGWLGAVHLTNGSS